MNARLEQCSDRLKHEIKNIETSLTRAGKHLTSATDSEVDAMHSEVAEAITKWEAKREPAAEAGQRLKHFIEEIKENAVSKFEDWKTDREISKLEKDADKKEEHAVDAITVAAFAALEAEVAILEALKARKIAVEVAG